MLQTRHNIYIQLPCALLLFCETLEIVINIDAYGLVFHDYHETVETAAEMKCILCTTA